MREMNLMRAEGDDELDGDACGVGALRMNMTLACTRDVEGKYNVRTLVSDEHHTQVYHLPATPARSSD